MSLFTILTQTNSFFKISCCIATMTHLRSLAIFNFFVDIMGQNLKSGKLIRICDILRPLAKLIPKSLTRRVFYSERLTLLLSRRFRRSLTILFLSWSAHLFSLFAVFHQLIKVVDVLLKFCSNFQFGHFRRTLLSPFLSVDDSAYWIQSVFVKSIGMNRLIFDQVCVFSGMF